MLLKRKIALAAGGLIFFLLLLVSLFTGAYFYLPRYLESKVLPRLAADAGISDFAVNVRSVGFFDADLGALRIGALKNPALVVQSVQIDYTPRGLYQQKIDKITVNGIELHGEIAGDEFKLRGFDLKKLMAGRQQGGKSSAAHEDAAPGISVQNLAIRNSRVIIEYQDRFYRIPVEFDIVPQDAGLHLVDIAARLYPRGQKISVTAELKRNQSRVDLNIDASGLTFGRFADITGALADITLTGEADMHAKAEVLWAPLRIASASASFTLRHIKMIAGYLKVQNAVSSQGEEIPLQIDLKGAGDGRWQITCGKLSMAAPMPLTLAGFDAAIKRNASALEAGGNFSVLLNPSAPTGFGSQPVKFRDPWPMQARFSALYHHPGKWQCEIFSEKSKDPSANPIRLNVDAYTLTSSPPELRLSAEAASKKIEAAYRLTASQVRMDSVSDSIYLPRVVLKGTVGLAAQNEAAARITFDLQAPDTGLKSDGLEIKIPEISIAGKLNRDDSRHMKLDAVLQFAGAGAKFSGLNVRLNGARGKIPFEWPAEEKTKKGSVTIAGLIFKDMNLGSLTGSIRQTATGFAFKGGHRNRLVPNLKLDFTGESRLFGVAAREANFQVEITRPAGAPEIDLGKFLPEAKGFQMNGKFGLNGDFTLNDRGFKGKLRADFNDGRLHSEQHKLSLEGIRMSLDFPELPRIRSSPGQRLQFSRLSLGDLTAEKGGIDFQIESARSFLIEKMNFSWCDGHVETQSMRLSPGIEDYRITFYCDRLNLAKVLEQFGAATAEGRGTVNGRIPLQYANGKISFDDGFLFSTPGDGGKIRITGSEILTAGIPPDTPQYVQMELASEALKDYDYTWTKLNITSQGEELLLQMQMDGKPAGTLPFVYRKDIGGFAKIEADAKGSKFQGIRLDVNFRLPLNKLLQYRNLIHLMKKSN